MPLALLTQTTLSLDDTKELSLYIKVKFPHITTPPAGDICYATTNRQNAVKKLAEIVDTVLVIGSKNSSNSAKLKLTALKL
jgi:4-hydroxy-3-methylbut-2-en-1-yl diphosphate reductase